MDFVGQRLHVSGYARRLAVDTRHAGSLSRNPHAAAAVGEDVEKIVGKKQWSIIIGRKPSGLACCGVVCE